MLAEAEACPFHGAAARELFRRAEETGRALRAEVERATRCSCGDLARPTCPVHGTEGTEYQRDVGIAPQHRARLGARIAGNVASGMVGGWLSTAYDSLPSARMVADVSGQIAEEILASWGL